MSNVKLNESSNSAVRCGVVYPAVTAKRLREIVYRRRGDYLPKQYLDFVGTRSMLEPTIDRAETLIPAQQLLAVIAKEHLRFSEFAAR